MDGIKVEKNTSYINIDKKGYGYNVGAIIVVNKIFP